MKKSILIILTALIITLVTLPCSAADTAEVYVTISDGSLVMARQPVSVADTDGDGILSINDALYLAHDLKYKGGAANGFASQATDYGVSLTKLWGVENGGAYGYYINNTSPMSLLDPVKDGDNINAYVYTDTAGYSDIYCYFDVGTVAQSDTMSLKLLSAGYDADWNPIVNPVQNAIITVDGQRTAFVTDENGVCTLTGVNAGAIISAVSDTQTLVPPAAIVTAPVAAPQTFDMINVMLVLSFILCLTAVLLKRHIKVYEK